MIEYLIGISIYALAIPPLFYWVSLTLIFTGFQGFGFWTLYVLLFPFLISILPFFIKRYFKKIKFILLPLVIFLTLQIVPLPRSATTSTPQALDQVGKEEPFAIGVGYPLSFAKLFIADSKDVFAGQFMFVPEQSIYRLVLLGYLIEGYVIFLIICGLIRFDAKPEKKQNKENVTHKTNETNV